MTHEVSDRARSRRRRLRLRLFLDITATTMMIIVAAVVIWMRWPKTKPALSVPDKPVSLEGATLVGGRGANIALLEFADFECPSCGQVARNVIPVIDNRYVQNDRLLFLFRHFPLDNIHPFAFKAAEAAECANRQGKFADIEARLFADQRHLDEASLKKLAETLNLDGERFARCLSGEASAHIKSDVAQALALGIPGTPTFFLGRLLPNGQLTVTRRFTGAATVQELDLAIDDLLNARESAPRRIGIWVLLSVSGLLAATVLWLLARRVRRGSPGSASPVQVQSGAPSAQPPLANRGFRD